MLSDELTVAEAYRRMALIRRFEERVLELSAEGVVAGSVHPCIGQEAIPVGATAALQPQDRVLATYRGHGWALACGSDPTAVLAEIAQKAGGVNGGRAGSALLSDPDTGFLGENSIVGAGVPIAAGVALATLAQGTDRVVLTSIGDGAMNQGATTEGMIFAAARNLPVIFICENNGWSEMTPIAQMTRSGDLAQRGVGLGIESHVVDGCDPFAVRDAVAAAGETCRAGQGPVLLECKTVRLRGHYNRDIEHYRPKDDIAAAAADEPLARLLQARLASGELDDDTVDGIDEEVSALLEAITETVRDMPAPDPATALDHLYAGPVAVPPAVPRQPARELTYQRAINQALKEELEARPELLLYGEDVGFAGGIFGVSRGLQKQFGADRVFDTPIAESAILGSAVGAGLEGIPTVVEIMWADFVFVALDQIVNQAANVRYINRSRLHAPVTIRMQQGVTPGSCAQHSQSIEALLAHVPGIKVGLPATPQDAYDMVRAAIADPDPTVLIEHRSLYQQSGEVSSGGAGQRAEGARLHRSGADLTILTWGAILGDVLTAAEQLAAEGVEATVVDLRWLRPLDDATIAQAVAASSGRVLVVHEATTSGGFGAEVAARITEQHFDTLTGPVRRLGTPDTRIPSAPVLQDALRPSLAGIVAAARAVAGADRVAAGLAG
ncbi:alpha-ketoacid dehydrogenase subunit alpha/beta [Blastococcus saxobsidens]|uniref:dihydrolipoyllysine-residue succinyltransferase n=1 Tax=Blastococcus saxobsidens (strain DD2) TaxID=1146883 RepID=H6RKG4_BLASD|nr:alpha-ketoacid dehydrogenase subunit alpha/beta [Blastococcus saxobsidens]CCG02383.1 Dehydrogenase E1 component [Blastococcus saxobsidens DD2]